MSDKELAALRARLASCDLGDAPAAAAIAENAIDVAEQLAARAGSLETLLAATREVRDRAWADAEQIRLTLAVHGAGVDPEGLYAGTPGFRLRQLISERDSLRALVTDVARRLDDHIRDLGDKQPWDNRAMFEQARDLLAGQASPEPAQVCRQEPVGWDRLDSALKVWRAQWDDTGRRYISPQAEAVVDAYDALSAGAQGKRT